jgi:hypothetical protein
MRLPTLGPILHPASERQRVLRLHDLEVVELRSDGSRLLEQSPIVSDEDSGAVAEGRGDMHGVSALVARIPRSRVPIGSRKEQGKYSVEACLVVAADQAAVDA